MTAAQERKGTGIETPKLVAPVGSMVRRRFPTCRGGIAGRKKLRHVCKRAKDVMMWTPGRGCNEHRESQGDPHQS